MSQLLLILFYLLSPALILYLNYRFAIVGKIGAVAVAYLFGMIAGTTGIIPDGSAGLQELLTMLTIPTAIPLLLFSSNIRQWFRLAGTTALSMFAGLFSVVMMVFVGFFIFHSGAESELWKTGGMLIGVYTGGTPNLASLKIMLGADEELYLLTHAYDMLLSGFYFLFMISFGQRFFLLFLRPYQAVSGNHQKVLPDAPERNPYTGIFRKKYFLPLLGALGLSVLIFGVAGGLSFLVPESSQMVTVMLIITTLGIGASMIPRINSIQKTFDLGMYLILIFSFVVASMVDLGQLAGKTPHLFYYLFLVIFGSLALHVVLSKIFRIDTDTLIVTSTALICSPPFVPVVAAAIKNREIVVSGLTVGIVGYAIGNYLGFAVAQVLQFLSN
jgi:uncharacterized membrane protein